MKTIVQFSENILKPYINDEDNKFAANIAPVEEDATSASQGYAVGQQLILDGVLYDVTAAITAGDALATTGAGANISAADDVTTQIAATNTELSSVKQALSDEVETRVELGAHNAVEPEVVHFMPVAASTGSDTTYTINVNVTCFVAKVKPNTDYVYNRSSGDRCLIMASPNYPAVDGACKVIINAPPSLPYTFNTGNNNYVVIYTNSTITTYDVVKPLLKLASDPSNEFTLFAMTNRELTEKVTPIAIPNSAFTVNQNASINANWSSKCGNVVQICLQLITSATINQYAEIFSIADYVPFASGGSYAPLNFLITDGNNVRVGYASISNNALSVKCQSQIASGTTVNINFTMIVK